MTKNKSWIIWLFAGLLLLSSCTFLQPGKQANDYGRGSCVPSFPDRDGWYGADGAYSIPLDERRTLWLFGDTFVSEDQNRTDRIGMDLIFGTTLAVSTCSVDTAFRIRYYLKKKDGRFVSSFGEDEWLWPQDPFIVRGILYIPLLVVRNRPDAPPPFNFGIAGLKMARIDHFEAEDPRQWPTGYLDWTGSYDSGIEALATTSVVHRGHVYFYPLYRNMKNNLNSSGNILTRISVDHLEQPAGYFEYWTSNGWQKELKPETLKIIFAAGVSELSVRRDEGTGEWRAIYLSSENKGSQLLYQRAPRPEGPWSRPSALIDSIPEVNPVSPLYDQHTFCYAGKEHRQFARDERMVVTYVCNSSENVDTPQSFLRRNLFLYRPVVRTIRP